MDGRWLGPCLCLDLVPGLGLGLGIHLRTPHGHGVELPHWSHDQPDFARLADSGQVAVQVHEITERVVSLYDNTSEKEASQPWSEQNHRPGGLPRPLFPLVSLLSVFSLCPALSCFHVLTLFPLDSMFSIFLFFPPFL